MKISIRSPRSAWVLFLTLSLLTLAVYMPGTQGGFLFDDFPNIVDNAGVQPPDGSIASLVRSALSSPSSDFKRPLASLSFAANYLATGTDPVPMKITNVVIHLINGLLAFLLARAVLRIVLSRRGYPHPTDGDFSAACVAGAWLLLPINLTAVLYVVQRMESLANIFVLLGLLGYLRARQSMQTAASIRHLSVAASSLIVPTVLGAMAKETAVMLPLYAFVADGILFRWRSATTTDAQYDRRVVAVFAVLLGIPMVLGLGWLLPGLLRPSGWSTRDFTMSTRLLTEARVVLDYMAWTVFPNPESLSFYHDDLIISRNVLSPWTTLPSIIGIFALAGTAWIARDRAPLSSLGLSLYIAAHLLTGTILPLELVYEHRNYFSSLGIVLAIVPALAQPTLFLDAWKGGKPARLVGPAALAAMFFLWAAATLTTSYAWRSPLALAAELASRAPGSPRAQYELGRTYIILSRYDATSPFIDLVYPPLEKAAGLPNAGVLPEQALIFFNSRMQRPIRPEWWNSMEQKLRANKVTVQDESALAALVQCDQTAQCHLPSSALTRVYIAALSHPDRSPRLVANYGNFAWNQLNDHPLATRMLEEAVAGKPGEPAYRVTLIRMLVADGRMDDARAQRDALVAINIGGAWDNDIADANKALGN